VKSFENLLSATQPEELANDSFDVKPYLRRNANQFGIVRKSQHGARWIVHFCNLQGMVIWKSEGFSVRLAGGLLLFAEY